MNTHSNPRTAQQIPTAHDLVLAANACQRRVLHAGAQSQCQAVAQTAHVGRVRGVTANALVRAPHVFYVGAVVVHDKGVPVDGDVAEGQSTKIDTSPSLRARQERFVHRIGQGIPLGCMSIQALAHARTQNDCSLAKRLRKERVTTKSVNGFKVILTLNQQPQVAFEHIAAGNATQALTIASLPGSCGGTLENYVYQWTIKYNASGDFNPQNITVILSYGVKKMSATIVEIGFAESLRNFLKQHVQCFHDSYTILLNMIADENT